MRWTKDVSDPKWIDNDIISIGNTNQSETKRECGRVTVITKEKEFVRVIRSEDRLIRPNPHYSQSTVTQIITHIM